MEDHVAKRSSATGRFVSKPLGREKAAKFALVEGVTLSQRSAKTLAGSVFSQQGDVKRSAILESFKKPKKNKV